MKDTVDCEKGIEKYFKEAERAGRVSIIITWTVNGDLDAKMTTLCAMKMCAEIKEKYDVHPTIMPTYRLSNSNPGTAKGVWVCTIADTEEHV